MNCHRHLVLAFPKVKLLCSSIKVSENGYCVNSIAMCGTKGSIHSFNFIKHSHESQEKRSSWKEKKKTGKGKTILAGVSMLNSSFEKELLTYFSVKSKHMGVTTKSNYWWIWTVVLKLIRLLRVTCRD